jgi:hypothetical protein
MMATVAASDARLADAASPAPRRDPETGRAPASPATSPVSAFEQLRLRESATRALGC